MNTRRAASELAEDLLERSTCSVQVAAVLEDDEGIFAWGWNSAGSGFGLHAEAHAILRANPKRLRGATIWVASQRKKNKKVVLSKPCPACQERIDNAEIGRVIYRDTDGTWVEG